MDSFRTSVITYLPFAVSKKGTQQRAQEPQTRSLGARFAATLAQATRARRSHKFFQRKAEQREVIARTRAHPIALVTQKLSKLVALFSKSSRPMLKAKLQALFSGAGWESGFSGFLNAIRNVYKRLRGGNAAELLTQELLRKEKRRRQAFLNLLFHALAIQGRNLLRGKRTRLRHEQIQVSTTSFVGELLETQVSRVAILVCAQREAATLRTHAVAIQHAWRRTRRKKQSHREAKHKLLDLLSGMAAVLDQDDKAQQQRREVLDRVCRATNAHILNGTVRRLAVRVIQRVWRGYRARRRVFEVWTWKRKKAMQKVQRERLRKAREALLQPSTQEQHQQSLTNTRIQARKQKAPLILPPGYRVSKCPLTYERASLLLEPLPLQYTPPKISTLTRAKTQKVPFAKFEKICLQHAKVNAHNLWVAIPVGFDANEEEDSPQVGNRKTKIDGEHARKRTAKNNKRKKNRFFAAQYDWVPATLLQHELEQP